MSTETRLAGVTSMATRRMLDEIAADHARETGVVVAFAAMGGVAAARRLREGLRVDLVAMAGEALDGLIGDGFATGPRLDYARSAIALAVPLGAPRPDIGDEDALRRAMLAAPRVAYSTGPSGDHLRALWARWGCAEEMASRARVAPAGEPVAALLARGEAEIGVQQESELIGEAGIDIVGHLPRGAQRLTVFSAALAAGCAAPDDARAFLRRLASPAAAAAIRRHGMTPA